MQKILYSIFLITVLMYINITAHARLFFVGSNPFYSIIAFPQDIRYYRSEYIGLNILYQNSPYWGNIDEPLTKPNNSYTSIEEHINFSTPEGETEKSEFNAEGDYNIYTTKFYYFRPLNKKIKGLFTLTCKYGSMTEKSWGKLRAEETNQYIYIPFNFESYRGAYNIYIESILGFYIGFPAGIKVGIGRESMGDPESSFRATARGIDIDSKRILWGWSTTGCNHIFEYKHINGDAWFLDYYSKGSIYQFDFQLGATFSWLKLGNRLRYRTGDFESYKWKSLWTISTDASPEEKLKYNFEGEYQKQKWGKNISEIIERIYGNIKLLKERYYRLNLLAFFGIDFYKAMNVNSENPDITNDVEEEYKNHIIELNPNINIFAGRGIIVDGALLFEFSWTKYENTYERWHSGLGGTKRTYWDTSVYAEDEYSWEDFSYADEYFFDTGVEIDFLIPLIKKRRKKLSIFVMLMKNNKYTFQTKYYGYNEDTEDDIKFNITGRRENYTREIWLNSAISIIYEHNKYTFRLTYFEPLVYSLKHTTEVFSNGESVYYHEIEMQTAVQESARIAIHPARQGSAVISFYISYKL